MSIHNARINMIKQQLRTGNVLDDKILSLYDRVPRDEFLPARLQSFGYSDMQIPLSHHQCMMTPLEEALLLQSLGLQGHEVVLEIGTGTGFLTALLSHLCKQVVSVDYYADFTSSARAKLAEHGRTNVELFTGDASQGWLDRAPYDVIVFTGAIEQLTEIQRLQMAPGGKLFAIVGKQPVMQGQLHTMDCNAQWSHSVVFETSLPPLVDQLKHVDFNFQDRTLC